MLPSTDGLRDTAGMSHVCKDRVSHGTCKGLGDGCSELCNGSSDQEKTPKEKGESGETLSWLVAEVQVMLWSLHVGTAVELFLGFPLLL